MKDEELAGLQNPGNWEFSKATRVPGGRKHRAIVSVAFPSEDFQRVCQAAEKAGLKVSQYIRRAALEKADPPVHRLGDTVTSATIPKHVELAWTGA